VGLVVAVPTAQGGIAGVGKKKLQRRRFDAVVANPNGIESFSPALADEIGLRRVIAEKINPERVEFIGANGCNPVGVVCFWVT
jgi:hypothetical protein